MRFYILNGNIPPLLVYLIRGWNFGVTCGKNCCGLFHVKVRKIKCKPTWIHPYYPPPITSGLLPWSTIIHIIQRDFKSIQPNSVTLRPSSHTQAIDHHKRNYKPDSSLKPYSQSHIITSKKTMSIKAHSLYYVSLFICLAFYIYDSFKFGHKPKPPSMRGIRLCASRCIQSFLPQCVQSHFWYSS